MTVAAPQPIQTPIAPVAPSAPSSPITPQPIDPVNAPVSTGIAAQQLPGIAPITMPSMGALSMQVPTQQVIMNRGGQSGNPLVSGVATGLAAYGLNDLLQGTPGQGTPGQGYGGALAQLLQGNPTGAAIQGAGTFIGNQLLGTPLQAAAPFVGPALNLINNGINSSTIGSTALGYAGSALGNLVLPGIGGVIGGALGGILGGGCFITQAVMLAIGKNDDAALELQVMRAWRDGYLLKNQQLAPLVKEYYDIAPLVVEAIDRMPNAQEVYIQLYHDYILPTVQAILAGDMELALKLYTGMLAAVAPLAHAMEPSPLKQAAIAQLGNHSAQVQQAIPYTGAQ